MRIFRHILPALTIVSLSFLSVPCTSVIAQSLLLDNFDDTSGPVAAQGDGIVDVSKFRAPFGGSGDFVGRTQFRFNLPSENIAAGVAGSTDGKVAVLNLDTYDSVGMTGTNFLGTDLITKQNFARGGGLRMTTRMRVDASTAAQGGIVAAPFLYEVTRENPPGTLVRDEIDHELLTNESVSGTSDRTLTNVWNDGPFTGSGSGGTPVFINNPSGFDITQFHDYRTDWSPNKVEYYIDGNLVRTETSVVPDDPMRAHVNFWVPDAGFASAYDGSFVPAASAGANTNFKLELDRLQVERFNTTSSANLLVDPSFEDQTPPASNETGGWTLFNNASYDGIELAPQDGNISLKTFGPFTGSPNASGAYQNVAALPGEEFSASIYAQSPSADSILGNENYTNITMSFVNAGGDVIGSVNFSPGTNEQNTPIFDGRDANMIQDEWVQYSVDAVAPATTAFVRVSAFFIQLNNEGGAVFFDNASLTKLTSNVSPASADYDGDGDVDGNDFLVWQRGNSTNGLTPGDLALWKSQYGTNPLTANVGAVPEPSTVILILASLVTLGGVTRQRR